MADPEDNFGGPEAAIRNHQKFIDRLETSAAADLKESLANLTRSVPYLGAGAVSAALIVYTELFGSGSDTEIFSDKVRIVGGAVTALCAAAGGTKFYQSHKLRRVASKKLSHAGDMRITLAEMQSGFEASEAE